MRSSALCAWYSAQAERYAAQAVRYGLARVGRERLGAALEVGGIELARPRDPRLVAGRRVVAARLAAARRRRDQACALLQRGSSRGDAHAFPGAGEIAQRRRSRRGQHGGVGRRGARRHLHPGAGVATGPERRVGALDEVAQAGAVGRGEVDRRGRVGAAPGLERVVVGGVREALGGGLLEHLEARVQARRERLRAQQAGAEAVDGADPGPVDGAGALVVAEFGEAAAQALGELARGLLGEGQGENRVDGDAVLADGLGDPLDHHGGLARAGVGGEQAGAGARLDRGELLVGEGGPGLIALGRSPGARSRPVAAPVRTGLDPRRAQVGGGARGDLAGLLQALVELGAVADVAVDVAPGNVVADDAARALVGGADRLVERADHLDAAAAHAPRARTARPGSCRPRPSGRPGGRCGPCSRG